MSITHTTVADGTFSTAGATDYNAAHTVTAPLTLAAGGTGTAALEFTSQTLETVPDAGDAEYDGKALYFTPQGAERGVIEVAQTMVLSSDFGLSAALGVQRCLPGTAGQVALSSATTYLMEGQYILNTGATTHTTALAFAAGGSLAVGSLEYFSQLWSAAANTIATASSTTHVSGVASKVINATSTAVYTLIYFSGVLRVTTGGTIIPQINFSANPTGTNLMKAGSYIKFAPIGSNTAQTIGNWS